MFRKNVFSKNTDYVEWIFWAGKRAIRTILQVLISLLTVGQLVTDINFLVVYSICFMSGILSLLMSMLGLPETLEVNKEDK